MTPNTETFLLNQLSKPGFHGGDQLGKTLGISRVAVSKHMSSLRKKGLPLISVAGKGYALEEGISLIDKERITHFIDKNLHGKLANIYIHQQLDSTNSWLAEQDFSENRATLCLTESQPAGRGRRDRQWHSSAYRNLMFSLSWRYPNWPAALSSLSLLAGLITAEALELCGVKQVKIKWPNDIYLDGKKLGGLLVSARGEASGACDLVAGIGINHHILKEQGCLIDQDWIDLQSAGYSIDRNQLAALLTEGFIDLLPKFETQGFSPFAQSWNNRCLYKGDKVRLFKQSASKQSELKQDQPEIIGICMGVDKEGVLKIQDDKGLIIDIRDADMSMRPI